MSFTKFLHKPLLFRWTRTRAYARGTEAARKGEFRQNSALDGQPNDDLETRENGRFQHDFTFVERHDFAGDRQPYTAAGFAGVESRTALEHVGPPRLRNPVAIILDDDRTVAVRDADAGLRELAGVLDDVTQHFVEIGLVSLENETRRIVDGDGLRINSAKSLSDILDDQ